MQSISGAGQLAQSQCADVAKARYPAKRQYAVREKLLTKSKPPFQGTTVNVTRTVRNRVRSLLVSHLEAQSTLNLCHAQASCSGSLSQIMDTGSCNFACQAASVRNNKAYDAQSSTHKATCHRMALIGKNWLPPADVLRSILKSPNLTLAALKAVNDNPSTPMWLLASSPLLG
jgi:hypothetical protein